jgi:hypothetical protein
MTQVTPTEPPEDAPKRTDYGSRGVTSGPIVQTEAYPVAGMTLSRKHWDRLKEQIEEAKMGWSEVWLGFAFGFLGMAGAAFIAYVTLPRSDPNLPLSLHGELLVGAIASAVMFVICLLAWLHFRSDHNSDLDAVIRNMESHEHEQRT